MIVSPDCVDAEPVRERLRARGHEEERDAGFGSAGEVWRNPVTGDVKSLIYCRPGDRSKFLAQSVADAGA